MLLAGLVALWTAAVAAADDEKAVRQVFLEYKKALVGGDADAAVQLVDDETLAYFQELRGLAAAGSEEEIRARSFIDRLLVLSIRHTFEASEIATLSLEGLMGRATREGWISPQTIAQLEMGEVEILGDRATAQAMTTASATNPDLAGPVDGLHYEFQRIDGQWRFGFGSLVRSLDVLVEQLTSQLGASQDDFLFMLIESFSGEKVLPEVWERPPGGVR